MDYYQKAVKIISGLEGKRDIKERAWVQKYLGSNKPTKCVKTGDVQKAVRVFLKKNDLSETEFFKLIDNLYENAKTFEEMDFAAKLIGAKNDYRKSIDLKKLSRWLSFTHGWAECDCLCQSNFEKDEILERWNEWEKFLIKINKSKNIQQRRASLVLLCKTLRQTDEKKVYDLAIKLANNLKSEKEVLITKAISWILRSMYKNYKDELSKYLIKNKNSLPKIAYRETNKKLNTGRKNG